LSGVNKLADNVATTLGPKGRNVILKEKDKEPFITKDGVTVSVFVHLDDVFENAAVQILKQAASETNIAAGDGTTTATILAREIFSQAQRYLSAGASPIELKRGIDKAVEVIVENLKELSTPITSLEDVENIATISANNDPVIGKLIATAIDKAGADGAITVEEAKSMETSLDVIEGFRMPAGYVASAFVTDERRGAVKYDSPLLLITDARIDTVEQILPILETVSRDGRPLVIFAEEIEGQALAALIMNTVRGTMKIAAVKAPLYGEARKNMLNDLAVSTGATFITRDSGTKLRNAKLTDFGQCKSIDITKILTTVIGGKGNLKEIDKNIDLLKSELQQTDDLRECEKIQDRITKLAAGVAVINVGAATEVEMTEKKHRIEDALEAVKAAQEEGILPGGGVALLRAIKRLKVNTDNEDQALGVEIVKKAVLAPLRQMATNAGQSPDLIEAKVRKARKNSGFNFRDFSTVDMYDAGIIDPLKVTRIALQNAASAAGTLITTSHAIIEI
jgi:chaperonin GroEL|tara:strand:+ start:8766 stop:10289 length:1524 start_codon:yes stop_codon:yes gene_type:complete